MINSNKPLDIILKIKGMVEECKNRTIKKDIILGNEVSKHLKECFAPYSIFDDIRGVRVNNDNIIIMFGYTGMGSTSYCKKIDMTLEEFLISDYINIFDKMSDFETNDKSYRYINISNEDICKFCQGTKTNYLISDIKDLDWEDNFIF